MNLTVHQRHARLVKIVRRTYQEDKPGSRLFPNTSGVAWQGNAVTGAGKVELFNPRPVYFGIPEPSAKGTGTDSGGSDLLGETQIQVGINGNVLLDNVWKNWNLIFLPILTGIEIKTGKSKLKKNQKIFRDWLLSVNGIYKLARECHCWKNWIPIYINSKITTWEIPECPDCNSKGFNYEDGK